MSEQSYLQIWSLPPQSIDRHMLAPQTEAAIIQTLSDYSQEQNLIAYKTQATRKVA